MQIKRSVIIIYQQRLITQGLDSDDNNNKIFCKKQLISINLLITC